MDSQKSSANFTVQLPDDYIKSLAKMDLEADDSEVLHKDS